MRLLDMLNISVKDPNVMQMAKPSRCVEGSLWVALPSLRRKNGRRRVWLQVGCVEDDVYLEIGIGQWFHSRENVDTFFASKGSEVKNQILKNH